MNYVKGRQDAVTEALGYVQGLHRVLRTEADHAPPEDAATCARMLGLIDSVVCILVEVGEAE